MIGGAVLERLRWSLYRRKKLARVVAGFWGSPFSFVNGNIEFEGYNTIYEYAEVRDASLGLFSYVGINARVVNCAVGRFCSIGPGALVGGLGVHPTDWASTHPVFFSTKKQAGDASFSDRDYLDELPATSIGHDVWIGARAIVLDGCTVGDGAIIAAGAVVVNNVAPYAIVGGIPAKTIRMRYEPETIDRLLTLKWWDWPLEKLKRLAPLFRIDGAAAVDKLLAQVDS